MPSIRSLLSTLSLVTQTVLGLRNPVHRRQGPSLAASASCPNAQLSCHNSSAVDNLCCFNAPGGTLLQTQFWDTDPASGPEDSWTIHGLWPDNCDGTYSANCDASRAYTNISAILSSSGNNDLLDYMNTYWTSNIDSAESLWTHEWGKHGTCISTLEPDCYTDYKPTEEVPDYFSKTVDLFKSLPTYDWLKAASVTPSESQTYSLSEIQSALSAKHGASVYVGCADDGSLEEVWYFFNVRGSVQTGDFVSTEAVGATSSCPDDGVKYLPKKSSTGPSSTASSSTPPSTSTSAGAGPTPTGPPFSGKGYLNVLTDGKKKGCIISYGTWYTTGSCAGFTVTPSSSGFTLQSSKGDCGFSDGKLVCGADVSEASVFTADGSSLSYERQTSFYADAVPSGSAQGAVYSSGQGHGVTLGIEWQSL